MIRTVEHTKVVYFIVRAYNGGWRSILGREPILDRLQSHVVDRLETTHECI